MLLGEVLAHAAQLGFAAFDGVDALAQAMRDVETGNLATEIHATTTDEYAELFRGFNLMVGSLREEVQILQLSHDLAGELNLDVLLGSIMRATSELLDADRSTGNLTRAMEEAIRQIPEVVG